MRSNLSAAACSGMDGSLAAGCGLLSSGAGELAVRAVSGAISQAGAAHGRRPQRGRISLRQMHAGPPLCGCGRGDKAPLSPSTTILLVSWIRSRDLHILTSGVLTYTSDSRFEVLHGNDPDSWTLRLVGVQHKDGGRYECQVNTDPKLSLPVHLHVREPNQNQGDSPYSSDTGWTWKPGTHTGAAESRILGPSEQVVREGSTVTFTCEAPALPTSPGAAPLHWLHEGRLISLQAQRGGFSLETERGPSLVTSRLTVAAVTEADSGRYSCRPPGARPATVALTVIQGEHTEAMQGAGSASAAARPGGVVVFAALGVAAGCWWRLMTSHAAS